MNRMQKKVNKIVVKQSIIKAGERLTGVHWDNVQPSLTFDVGESFCGCIFLNWFVTKCFQVDFCLGELVSLSEHDGFRSGDDVTKRFCGAFLLLVTGDCPEGDRDPKWYFRCCVLAKGDGLSSLLSVDACIVSIAAIRCGSAFWIPTSAEHSCVIVNKFINLSV